MRSEKNNISYENNCYKNVVKVLIIEGQFNNNFFFKVFFSNLKLQSKRNFKDSDYDIEKKKILITFFLVCSDKKV